MPLNLRGQIIEMKDIDGDTPLHAACRCGAPTEVFVLLLEANPNVVWDRDYEGLTPLLRLWVRYFVTLGEGAISRVCKEKDLVGELDDAWEKTVLLLIVSYCGSIINSGEDEEISGLDSSFIIGGMRYIFSTCNHQCRLCEPLDNWPGVCLPVSIPTFERPFVDLSTVSSTKTTEILNNEEEGASTESLSITRTTKANIPLITTEKQLQPFLIIHALTKVDCPRAVIKIATKLYPNELNKLDVNGYTPLALATQMPIFREHDLSDEGYCIEDQIHGDDVPPVDYSGHDIAVRDNTQPRYFCHPYLQQQQRRSNETASSSVIQILLETSPEAASYSHPRTGRIPLHFSILSGKS